MAHAFENEEGENGQDEENYAYHINEKETRPIVLYFNAVSISASVSHNSVDVRTNSKKSIDGS